MNKKMIPYASLHEESKSGWVWVPPSEDLNSEFIEIINKENQKSIICERRIIDDNYIERYNKGNTKKIKSDDVDTIFIINEYYRNKLGGLATQKGVELNILNADGFCNERIKAYLDHPDPYLRMGIILGMIFVGLGILSLTLGLFSFFS